MAVAKLTMITYCLLFVIFRIFTREGNLAAKVAAVGGTVLVVDDEAFVADVCMMMLKALGFEVFVASSGREALEVYQKNQAEIDLVLLDVVMEDMGGGEAFDLMKKINPDVRVVLISGDLFNSEATSILKRGCDGFIHKPFGLKDMSETITAVLQMK
jgi:CheY-like chemotaxis protein